jgi:hypothetical protein
MINHDFALMRGNVGTIACAHGKQKPPSLLTPDFGVSSDGGVTTWGFEPG